MFDEQTVPIDNLDGCRREDCGGIPGGVYGRCIPGGFMAAYVVERVIGLRERGGNGSRTNKLFRKMKGKVRRGGGGGARRRSTTYDMEESVVVSCITINFDLGGVGGEAPNSTENNDIHCRPASSNSAGCWGKKRRSGQIDISVLLSE